MVSPVEDCTVETLTWCSTGNAIVLNDGPSSDSSDSSDSDAPQNGPCSNKRIFSTTCYNSSGKPAQLGAVSEIQDRQEAEPTAEQSLVEELDNFWGMHNTADSDDFLEIDNLLAETYTQNVTS